MALLATILLRAPAASACSLNPTAVISAPAAASSSHIHGTGISFVGSSSTANCGWISAYIWRNGVTVLSYSSSFSYNVTLEPEQVDSVITVSLQVINSYGRSLTVYRTITIKRDHQSQYFVKDHLGSPRVVVDGKGAVLSYTDYYPFGMVMPGRASNISLSHDRTKFTGYLLEEEGGQDLYHAGARSYDPIIGRFTSQDRFKEKYPSFTPYQYAALNPLMYNDVNGDSIVLHLTWSGPNDSYHASLHHYNEETGDISNVAEGMPQNKVGTLSKSSLGWGKLVKEKVERDEDNIQIKNTVPIPEGMTETEFVGNIMSSFESYDNSVSYNMSGLAGIPKGGPNSERQERGGNSNSLVGSVLRQSGSEFRPTYRVPGWDTNVLPKKY